jgi:hypothetical protein
VRDKQNPPKSKRAVVDAPKIIMNGMSTSTAFNSNGTVLAARTVDYAINISKNNVPQ